MQGGVLKARLTCKFNAVKKGQLNVNENEEVNILHIENGYATCEKLNGQQGEIPTYFLEMPEMCMSFADQIRYRRLWYAIVDETRLFDPQSSSQEVFIKGLGHVPKLAMFVQTLPNSPKPTPCIAQEFEDQSQRIGDEARFECRILSQYEYELNWTGPAERNKVLIERGKDNKTVTLIIKKVGFKEAGQHKLTVSNSYGKCSTMAILTVLGVPGRPINLDYLWLKNTSIQLRWEPAFRAGSQQLWYTIEYRKEGNSEKERFHQIISGIKECYCKISKLSSHHGYYFRVYAYNPAFRGEVTSPLRVAPDLSSTRGHLSMKRVTLSRIHDLFLENKIEILGESFSQLFLLQKAIGKGRFSTVYLAECRSGGSRHFAAKTLNFLSASIDENIEKSLLEISALISIKNHPNLVCYVASAIHDEHLVILLNKINGPEVLRFISQQGFISENLVRKFALDLLNALEYLHSFGWAHLSIKPEDLLIEYRDGVPTLVLIDLGSAIQTCSNTSKQLSIWQGGALEFCAPEQLAHRPCQKSDIWSFGIFIFVLASGVSPFADENDAILRHNILNICFAANNVGCSKKIPQNFQDFVGPKILNLLKKIFVLNVSERPTADECLENEWMVEECSEELFMVDYLQDYLERRRNQMRSSYLLHEPY